MAPRPENLRVLQPISRSRGDVRVLVVEDDRISAEIIKEQLEQIGFRIIGHAEDGEAAIEQTTLLRPDVIVMDIQMPKKNGIEAAREIQASCPTPIVIVTSHDEWELVEQATRAGVGAYLIKPPNLKDMERAITISLARFEDMMRLRQLNRELKEALAKVKVLSGLLPICSSCKKVRDDHGYWRGVEAYIQEHSNAEFSHGLCPECVARLYPDFSAANEAPAAVAGERAGGDKPRAR